LAALFTFIRAANAELDRGGSDLGALARARSAFAVIDGVLDLAPRPEGTDGDDDAQREREQLRPWVEEKLAERREARARRDYARADAIRRELEERGVELKDGPKGTEWRVVRRG
jgi:cysteinyl-tRNA synthetase